MRFLIAILTLTNLATISTSHGIVTHPPIRTPGAASLAACGPEITTLIKSDNQSGIEVLHKASVSDPLFDPARCELVVCKGLQLADNLHNIQRYVPGEEVNIQVNTRIPHKGWVNVAIVDTEKLFLIGDTLKSFETDSLSGYELGEGDARVDMDFNITIPRDLGGRCEFAGDCVLQWTWFGRVVKQTYESCVDFIVTPSSEFEHGSETEKQRVEQKKLAELRA